MTELTRPAAKPVQIYLPKDVVDKIDSLASVETISRASWVCRLIIGATRGVKEGPAA